MGIFGKKSTVDDIQMSYMLLHLEGGESVRVFSHLSKRGTDGVEDSQGPVYVIRDELKYGEGNLLALSLLLYNPVVRLDSKGYAPLILNTERIVAMEGPFNGSSKW